jgi:3-oxoacyl-[acyl-carrier-protein] synthase-1
VADILSTGLVSSLGYDTVSACAAARAGRVRPMELPFAVPDADGDPRPVVGHCAELLTEGLEGDDRLARLLAGALEDLLRRRVEAWHRDLRLGIYLALSPDEPRRTASPPAQAAPDARPRAIWSLALQSLGAKTEFPGSVASFEHASTGHSAVYALCARAQQDLAAGDLDLALVAAVDSLCSATTLRRLDEAERLKTAQNPVGLAPGEAAVALLLSEERLDGESRIGESLAGESRDAPSRIELCKVTESPAPLLGDARAHGRGLDVLLDQLGESLPPSEGGSWFVLDHNGEDDRARDWGAALQRVRDPQALVQGSRETWYPAASFGDCGAAAGGLAICMAAEAFARGYAPAPHAVLLCSSDGPERSACVITNAP